jgi:hypothetical protein
MLRSVAAIPRRPSPGRFGFDHGDHHKLDTYRMILLAAVLVLTCLPQIATRLPGLLF